MGSCTDIEHSLSLSFSIPFFKAPISVDDIIERRRKENPKLKKHTLKRKRDSLVTDQDDNNGSDVDLGSDEDDAANSLQLSEDEDGEGMFLHVLS